MLRESSVAVRGLAGHQWKHCAHPQGAQCSPSGVQLIEQPAARSHLSQMLCLIDHDRNGPTIAKGLFDSIAIITAGYLPGGNEASVGILFQMPHPLVLDQRLVYLAEEPSKMIAPIETPGFRRYRFHSHHRNALTIDFHFASQIITERLLSFEP